MDLLLFVGVFTVLLLRAKSEVAYNLDDLPSCHNLDYCTLERINIVCNVDNAQAQRIVNCIRSSNKPSYQEVSLKLTAPPKLEGYFFEGLEMWQLTLKHVNVSKLPEMVFSGIKSLQRLGLETGKLTELPYSVRDLPNLTELHVSQQNLQALQKFTFHDMTALTNLNLRQNLISEIHTNAFDSLRSLYSLNLGSNHLTEVPVGVFKNLAGLHDLDLGDNKIAKLKNMDFAGLKTLNSLRLSRNPISVLPNDVFAGLSELRYLYLYGNKLTHIPKGIQKLTKLTHLYLSGNDITELGRLDFYELTSLQSLHLKGNKISSVHVEAFVGLEETLKELHLKRNGLTEIPALALQHMTKLTLVSFGGLITSIKPHTFKHFGHMIKTIDLRGNRITHLDKASFLHLPKLRLLSLDENQLHTYDYAAIEPVLNAVQIFELETEKTIAKKLILENITASEFPNPAFAKLRPRSWWTTTQPLETLELDKGNLSSICLPVKYLESLVEFRITNQKLKTIPNFAMEGIVNLTRLDLSSNLISEFGQFAFAGLNRLTYLNLAGNDIPFLPTETFTNLSKLQTLCLDNNKITDLKPNTFLGLSSLRFLNLTHNKIASVNKNAFDGIQETLQALILKDNQLKDIPVNALQNMRNLLHVSFGNMIEYIESDTFKGFGQTIETIDLNGNRISSFSKTAFHHLPSLKYLFLADNLLTTMDFNVFQPVLTPLKVLQVTGNPLRCSCDLYWYYEWTWRNAISFDKTWFADHQHQHGLQHGTCISNGNVIQLENDCKQLWKSLLCNASGLYGCMSRDFCGAENGC